MRKISVILFLFIFAIPLASSSFAADGLRTTITASIDNIVNVKQYVAKDTVLQLVKVNEDGNFSFGTDSQGRFYFKSDLVKIPFPKIATFTIVAKNLEPGKYMIAAQLLTSNRIDPMLMKKDKEAIIEVPEHLKSAKTFDLGHVSFRIK